MEDIDKKIKSLNVGKNNYKWLKMEDLEDNWRKLKKIIKERDIELEKEEKRKEENEKMRKEFEKNENDLKKWLKEKRKYMMEGYGYLEKKMEDKKSKENEVSESR